MDRLQAILKQQDVQRLVYSLVQSELCRSRNIGSTEFFWPISNGQHQLGDQGIALDSMERMDIASQIHSLFKLFDTDIGDRLLAADSLEQYADLVWVHAQTSDICFQTSGSTGEPQNVDHSIVQLLTEATEFSRTIGAQRVITLAPCHHIYGFIWGVLLPRVLKRPVLEHADAQRAVHQNLRPGDLIIGTPLWWRYFVRNRMQFPNEVTGITSTAPMDAAIWQALEGQGLRTLHEIYGASELGGIGHRSRWDNPFELLERWDRNPSHPDQLLNKATQTAVTVPDLLAFSTGRHFALLGRKDLQVQVAGANVNPTLVAKKLAQLNNINHCQVRLMSPDEGYRLKAQLVTEHTFSSEEMHDVRQWCKHNLSAPERPHLTFANERLANVLGKDANWTIEMSSA